jgi:hypothetical protein
MPVSVTTPDELTALANRLDTVDNDFRHRIGVLELGTPPPPTTTVLLSDTFSTVYNLLDGQTSPDGKWKMKYVSGGKVFSDGQVLTMYPKTVTAPDQTASTLLLSTKIFKDFQLDIDVKLNKQLRLNSLPETWEAPWLFWSYNDEQEGPLKRSNHHYYVVLHTNKFEFGKKDNKPGDVTNEQQIFLKTLSAPSCKPGIAYHATVIKKGIHVTIKINGITVVDMDDQPNDPTKMAQGFIGLYGEDSSDCFDNVNIISA